LRESATLSAEYAALIFLSLQSQGGGLASKLAALFDDQWKDLARLAGLEPATYGLEVRCSIQLSYRRNVR
jgi:hypothetical protein